MELRVKLLSSTALAAAAVLSVSAASAQDMGALEKRVQALEKAGGGQYVARSKKTMNLVVSGHVNQMAVMVDSGDNSGIVFTGNNQSQTRFRFVGTGKISDDRINTLIREHFDLRPKGLIAMLDLLRPIYKPTAAYGHFGREDLDLSWEKTDKAEALKVDAGI